MDAAETPREQAFCAHTVMDPGQVMVVNDATQDERFVNNPLVTGDPHIKFYAGAPLVTASGLALGALCVIDRTSRDLTQRQQEALETIATEVATMLQLRQTVTELEQTVLDQDAEVSRLVDYQRELERAGTDLQQVAMTDPVSGLGNRRALDARLAEDVARALRYRAPVSIAMIDIDAFKAQNDTLGHVAGDEAIRHVGRVLDSVLRTHDFVGRYGGDEFPALLINTSAVGARLLSERLRRAVAAMLWRDQPLTVSIGYATLGGNIT
jgi:diguanylate cyclase (GGDEF)-like protein